MVCKRGQVTIFILLGLVILIAALFLFYFNSDKKSSEVEKNFESQQDIMPIRNYIESCIKLVGEDAIVWIGEHGGYYELPTYSTKDYSIETAYYFYENSNIMPSKTDVEEELSKYLNKELSFCLRNFVDFTQQGFDIEQGEIVTTTIIRPGNVLFNVNFPVVVKKDKSKIKLNSFSNSVDKIRLNTVYGAVNSIINEQMKDFESICLSYLFNLTIENDLYINTEKLSDDTILFTITDFNSIINNSPYKYIFANKYEQYSCSNPPADPGIDFYMECLEQEIEESGYGLYFENIPDMTAVINETFYYKVNAIGLNLNFSDHTYLFDINETTGEINFTPASNQIGIHDVWINVKDGLGNEKYDTFLLNITEN